LAFISFVPRVLIIYDRLDRLLLKFLMLPFNISNLICL